MKEIDVLYEDNHLVIVNKPGGLLSQPTDLEHDSVETRVKEWIKKKYQKPGNVFAGVIHRLDKPVSGILVLAKTSKALARLNSSMRSRQLQKTYLAIVEGAPAKKEGALEHYLVHGDHISYVSDSKDTEAKLARLSYKISKELKGYSKLEIVLETGRYHQIRCQFAAVGYPVVGDFKYGAHKGQKILPELPLQAIALHHYQLRLIHPVTQKELVIEAEPPAYMKLG